MSRELDLNGPWKAARSSSELERRAADPDLDDGDWTEIDVPGHWGLDPDLDAGDTPVVHRRHFAIGPRTPGRRRWLRLDGVLSEAEVWLDGVHLGDTGVYFAPHRFDVTDLLDQEPPTARGEHVLCVTASCDHGRTANRRSLVGAYGAGPLAPVGSPGGLWGDVAVDTSGPVAITSSRLLCVAADRDRATLRFAVEVDALDPGPVRIDTSITGPDGRTAGGAAEHDLASGRNQLAWTVDIDRPDLWWPASLGDQPRYDVTVAVRAEGSEVSDRRHWRTGLRTVAVDDLQWTVNGRRLFVKGVAVGPHGRFPAAVDGDLLRRDVRTAADAGLDLIRVQGHVARPEIYDEADERGILVWQDLPLVGSYATSTRTWAVAAAQAVVDQLGHHPSVSLWCGHDEPNGPAVDSPPVDVDPVSARTRRLGRHLLPSWNRSVLDPTLRRALRRADPTRSVITRSGNLPNPVDFTGSDTHLWLGWHAGSADDLPRTVRRWPRLGSFIGAIGSQSVRIDDWPANAPDWPGAQRSAFGRYLPRAAYADGEAWALATQAYQAALVRTQIEAARRLKYRPTGGFCVVSLFDVHPDGGFGLLEADREPKPAFDALIDACRPVVVVADLPPPVVTPGDTLSLQIHAVSDLPDDLGSVTVTATAAVDDWRVERRWAGTLEADSCAFIATLELDVPDLTGALVIDLALEADERIATNRYQTVVIPPSEAVRPITPAGPRP